MTMKSWSWSWSLIIIIMSIPYNDHKHYNVIMIINSVVTILKNFMIIKNFVPNHNHEQMINESSS